MAAHGTERRYQQGCGCAACRRAHADAAAATRANNQARTASARRWREPWTAQEDSELRFGAGTRTERALRLGRTRSAVDRRLEKLRKDETA